ncbi:hypothetical protein [Nonomuraea sp. NPDC050643]|uniref:TRADD-N-associated membrane domain-containing protein n=1 Tax=Nonomuraea sp. NPDC050643 TaxID=3155660 RepID=UPI0033E4D41A
MVVSFSVALAVALWMFAFSYHSYVTAGIESRCAEFLTVEGLDPAEMADMNEAGEQACLSAVAAGPSLTLLTAVIVGSGLIAPILGALYLIARRRNFIDRYLIARSAQIGSEEARLMASNELELGRLWGLTEARLRIYHEIATRQAGVSFVSAQLAISLGFVVIAAASLLAFNAKSGTASITIGLLGGLGGALSAYIGRTFLRSQENAASHLRSYFDQPKEFFRYLAAERLLAHLSDGSKDASIDRMIQAIVLAERSPGPEPDRTVDDKPEL